MDIKMLVRQYILPPQVLFFLLPIALCTGRASQAGGIYFFSVLFPIFLHRDHFHFPGVPFFRLGSLFLAMFYLFPFADLLQIFFQDPGLAQVPWTFGAIMNESRFSSSLGITGLFFWLFEYLRGRRGPIRKPEGPINVFQIFTSGLTVGLLLLSIYVGVQFFTGFNFSDIAGYRPDRHMGSIFYRVTGFSNHPVSFAGFLLVILSFYWTFLCSRPLSRMREALSIYSLTIVSLSFLFIFLSGSRIAVLVALFLLCLIPAISGQISRKSGLIISLGVVFLTLCLFFASGIYHRFFEVFADASNSGLGDRKFFWQVHWKMFKDSPWIGNGRYFVDHYFREKYYNDIGFQVLQNKYNAHSVYLEVLADIGLIGAVLLVVLAISAMRLLKIALSAPGDRIYYHCFIAGLSASMLFGLTQNSLFDSPTMLITMGFLWMILWHRNYSERDFTQ